jgi:ABC-2 type transport system permease protein
MVFTLVQQNVLESSGETKIKALFLDKDGQATGTKLEELLNKADTLKLVKEVNGTDIDAETAKEAIAKGDYQLAVIVPEGLTKALIQKAKEAARNSLSTGNEIKTSPKKTSVTVPDLIVYFDPTVTKTVRNECRRLSGKAPHEY